MNYKMIVLDLDDTILNKEHELTEKTIDTISFLKNQGIKVTIATGRMYVSALPFVKKLNIDLPIISYNGAYVCNPINDKIIFHKSIPENIVKKIILEAERANMHLNLYYKDNFFVEERNEGVEIYENIAGVRGKTIGKLSSNFQGDSTKMLIIEKDKKKKEYYLNYFKDKYGDKLEITESKDIFIEFMAQGLSKGKALAELAKSLDLSQDKIIAIGDGFNDLEMLKWAGLGIAMKNAPQGVREKADMIAPPHDQDGVAQILQKIYKNM